VGPRVVRKPLDSNGNPTTDKNTWQDDAVGGDYYYFGRAELEIPLGSGAKEMGIRPSVFLDVGSVWGVTHPTVTSQNTTTTIPTKDANGNILYLQTDSVTGAQSAVTNSTNAKTGAANPLYNPTTIAPYKEYFYGDTALPRVSIGFGFNWNSPFGPFRIDIAKSLLHANGDDTKTFTFNVGTQF